MENSDTLPDTTSRPAADPRSQFPFTDVPEPEAAPLNIGTILENNADILEADPELREMIGRDVVTGKLIERPPVGSYPAAPAPRVEVDMMDPPFSSDPPADAEAAPQLESGFDIQEPATATGPLDESEPEL